MRIEEESNPLSRFPKDRPGKPRILADKKRAVYPCFCIQNIYLALFADAKSETWPYTRPPLIGLPGGLHSRKDLLSFLLPEDLFHQIEQARRDGRALVQEHDYKEFFLLSTNNNKITKLLLDLFSSNQRDSEKLFLEKIQNHFVRTLRAAAYRQPQLTDELRSLCDGVIVPASVSPAANAAAHALLDTGDHDTISRAIANVFISAMLGLYSMRYASSKTKRGFQFTRTYLLNKLGMEFIWTPETISGTYIRLQDAQFAYAGGQYGEACARICKWLAENERHAKTGELAAAYHIRGACLYLHPELCGAEKSAGTREETVRSRRAEGIADLEKCVSLDASDGEAHHILYDFYKDRDRKRAFAHLKAAFAQNHAKAVLESAALFLRRQQAPGGAGDLPAALTEKLTFVIEHEEHYGEVDVSECLYLRGQLLRRGGRQSDGERDFAAAARRGHEKARQELSRKERTERQRLPVFSDDPQLPCCFVNSWSGYNQVFASTLPSGAWSLFAAGETAPKGIGAETVRDIDVFLQQQHLTDLAFQRPRMVFLFLSECEERNLNECLMLLDRLFNIAMEAPEERRNALIDRIEIYVRARYEIGSMLMDANISDMGQDIYFRVHIADETRDAVHQLLCDAPLFLPFLGRGNREDSANVVLFGCTETNYRFIKESIACAYLGEAHPVTVTMLGADAEHWENRLKQECPGLYHGSHIACIRPEFLSCSLEETDFPDCIYGSRHDKEPDDALVRTLSRGNYFVVDLAGDYDSIRFAMELRTWLLRSGGTFDRVPFIAVKCVHLQNSYLASHLTLSGQAAGDTYYSRYDLFPFGVARELYSYRRLIARPRLEEVALRIHKSYYGGDERQAENDYYSFSYNADSSLLTAIGLSYRLFAGGAFFPQRERYLDFGAFDDPALLSRYGEAIRSKEELAAALEQSRWNGFMLSRGWEPAGVSQVRAYKDQSTGSSHKHLLAKLHPFIREWSELESDDLMGILGMLKSKFDYDRRPKATTRKSIQDMPGFLSRSGQEEEKTR